MVEAPSIESLVDRIVEVAHPQKVILFGSYASGAPGRDSDVDLLVVMNHRGPAHRVATRIRLAIGTTSPMDILVRSPAQLEKGIRDKDWFIFDMLEQGITLYDRSNQAVGEKGRRRLRRRFAPAAVT
jgi:predicted nucleotidyltransferase